MTEESAGITIGQPVAISTFNGWRHNYQFGYKVVRVTTTGQVAVSDEPGEVVRRFDQRLEEIGTGRVARATLHLNVEELQQKVENEKKLVEAAKAIAAVTVTMRGAGGWSNEALQEFVNELETKLTVAKEKLALCASESQSLEK